MCFAHDLRLRRLTGPDLQYCGRSPTSATEATEDACARNPQPARRRRLARRTAGPWEQPRIAFTIKESGDFTNQIGTVPIGTRSYIDGPHGNFVTAGRETEGIVFIAGGVGFAPVMGIVRQLKAEGYPDPLRLIYGNRVETQILYRDEIDALSQSLDFQVHYVLSEP